MKSFPRSWSIPATPIVWRCLPPAFAFPAAFAPSLNPLHQGRFFASLPGYYPDPTPFIRTYRKEQASRILVRIRFIYLVNNVGKLWDHPANEYLHDEKAQYLCAVNSLCGGFLTFCPERAA
jgi:hypothetical protein